MGSRSCFIKTMRWILFSILFLASPTAIPWYQEFGSQTSGVGAYDTSGRQPILIAFDRTRNCTSASLWLDGSLRDQSQSEKVQNINGILKIDNFRSWAISFDYIETNYWLPGLWVLKQNIPPGIVRELVIGHLLSITIGENNYTWSLVGSRAAILSAYDAC